MSKDDLYNILTKYQGESIFELLNEPKFIIPYKEYLRKNYPEVNCHADTLFDLVAAFEEYAKDYLEKCPYEYMTAEEYQLRVFIDAIVDLQNDIINEIKGN